MPFTSKSQIRTCYSGKFPGWNCDEWLLHTPSVCCLPEKIGRSRGRSQGRSRCLRKGEKIKGKVKVGPRGGKYFMITEKDSKGVICEIKVYV